MSKIFVVDCHITSGDQFFVRAESAAEAERIARDIEPEVTEFIDDEYYAYEMNENEAKKLDESDLLNGDD